MDKAVEISYRGIFANAGQICVAPSRVFVHESIHDAFLEKLVAKAKSRKVGNPLETGIEQGPQVNEAMFKRVINYIEIGKTEGAKLVAGGKPLGKKGYFIEPTIFADVTDSMRIAKEEVSSCI